MALFRCSGTPVNGLNLNAGEYVEMNSNGMSKGNINGTISFPSGTYTLIANIRGLSLSTITDSYTSLSGYSFNDFDDASEHTISGSSASLGSKDYVVVYGNSSGPHNITFS